MIPLNDNVAAPSVPVVTLVLVALSLAVLLWQVSLSDSGGNTLELARAGVSERDAFTIEHGAIPYRLAHPGSRCGVTIEDIVCGRGRLTTRDDSRLVRVPDDLDSPPRWTTLLTSPFMQLGLLTAAANLLALLVFGRTIEASLGRVRFALFFTVAALAALALQTLLDTGATGPIIGASGAVAGVIGAYVATYSRARVVGLVPLPLLGTLVMVPAAAVVVVWFLLQLLPAVGQLATPDAADGGLAYLSYVATFLLGAAAARLLIRRPLEIDAPTVPSQGQAARG